MEFKNRYQETKKTLAHFYKKCVYRYYRWLGIVLMFFGGIQVATVVADIMGFFAEPLNSKVRLFFFDLGIILIVLGILLLCQHLIVARVAFRQARKMGGGKAPETIIRFGEDIHLSMGSSRSIYRYEQIYRVMETEEEYALMIGRHTAIRARKGCFVSGEESLREEADFPEFIRERCPGVRWKRG